MRSPSDWGGPISYYSPSVAVPRLSQRAPSRRWYVGFVRQTGGPGRIRTCDEASPPRCIVVHAVEYRKKFERQWAGSRCQEHSLVFTTIGTPLDNSNVTHNFQKTLSDAKIRKQRFLDLRHCAATLLLAQGADLRTIMDVLGHSTITLTANTYVHLTDATRRGGSVPPCLLSRLDRAVSGVPARAAPPPFGTCQRAALCVRRSCCLTRVPASYRIIPIPVV